MERYNQLDRTWQGQVHSLKRKFAVGGTCWNKTLQRQTLCLSLVSDPNRCTPIGRGGGDLKRHAASEHLIHKPHDFRKLRAEASLSSKLGFEVYILQLPGSCFGTLCREPRTTLVALARPRLPVSVGHEVARQVFEPSRISLMGFAASDSLCSAQKDGAIYCGLSFSPVWSVPP